MSCGCGGACCQDEGLHGLGFFGAISADEAAQQAAALSSAFKSNGVPVISRFAAAGRIDTSTPGFQYCPSCSSECAGTQPAPGGNLKLIQTGTGLALSGLQMAVSTGIIGTSIPLAPFTLGISAVIGLFSVFMAHHAQAVAREQSTLCAAVPAANNYLEVIEQAVQSGQIDPQHGIAALNSLLSDFKSAVGAILKMDSSQCNAACYLVIALTAIVNYLTSEYQDLASQQTPQQAAQPLTAPPVPSSPGVVTSRPNTVPAAGTPTSSSYSSFYSGAASSPASAGGLPSWLPIAAVGLAAFLLVKG